MDVVIHVGFRKTATTWLQEILFPQLSINYIGKTEANYPNWLIEWHYADDFYFEQRKEVIKENFISCLDQEKTNLLSSEAFTNTASIYNQAYRIKNIYPQAKILITLRNPVDMVWSHYRHDIQEGDCFVDIEHWLDWQRTPYVMHKRKTIYLPDFLFDESITLYRDLFGSENVCVLKYEDMQSNNGIYFSELFKFLGVKNDIPSETLLSKKINESPTESESLEILRYKNLNSFLQKHHLRLQLSEDFRSMPVEGLQNSSELDNHLRHRLIDYFKGKVYGYY